MQCYAQYQGCANEDITGFFVKQEYFLCKEMQEGEFKMIILVAMLVIIGLVVYILEKRVKDVQAQTQLDVDKKLHDNTLLLEEKINVALVEIEKSNITMHKVSSDLQTVKAKTYLGGK